MKEKIKNFYKRIFLKNKIFIGIIIFALIISSFIYLVHKKIVEQSAEWTLYMQSAPYQPFSKFSGLSLPRCQDLGQNWLLKPSNLYGEYSCCRKCKLLESGDFLECEECYVYNRRGLRAHDKVYIPFLFVK
jgi:hypothetical protein